MFEYPFHACFTNQMENWIWRSIGQVFCIIGLTVGKAVIGVKGCHLIDAFPALLTNDRVNPINKKIVIVEVAQHIRYHHQCGVERFGRRIVKLDKLGE